MAQNLRDRLRRIQNLANAKSNAAPSSAVTPRTAVPQMSKGIADNTGMADDGCIIDAGWETVGLLTVKKIFDVKPPLAFPAVLPGALPILVPDFREGLPPPEKLLFFDLETSGLSGGAGTVAFLAAFGRFVPYKNDGFSLRITQYLLLDYPGEYDFLQALLAEFEAPDQLVASYNGKTFDSQILKTRCLMNGIQPPQYRHADLLYPCRRLWKRMLANCSQATIETEVLGIDRAGDTPGSLAPEIWFSFLKTADSAPLMEICAHNRRDISGLAAILAVLARIASGPCGTLKKYPYDLERVALRWHDALRRTEFDAKAHKEFAVTEKALLRLAAARGSLPVLRILAIDAEWRLGDYARALGYCVAALSLENPGGLDDAKGSAALRLGFEKRRERLMVKIRSSV